MSQEASIDGSEAKGRIAAHLTRPEEHPGRQVVGVRVGGSNAGHTVYGRCPTNRFCHQDAGHQADGPADQAHPWRLRHIPVAAVSNPDALLYLAAGSEVDIKVLTDEANELESAGYKVWERLTVDATATVVESRHQREEQRPGDDGKPAPVGLVQRIGSTGKGIGAARADRAMRRARQVGDLELSRLLLGSDTSADLYYHLASGASITIEGTQGFGLGQHAGHYPFTTSADCRAVDFLAMAGLSPWHPSVGSFGVYLVYRTRPIRVAGNSGPMYEETTWEELGLEPELTTVTRKVRRVGEWDSDLAARALTANGGPVRNLHVCVTMLDQLFPKAMGVTRTEDLPWEATQWLYERANELGCEPALVGTGPHTLIDLR